MEVDIESCSSTNDQRDESILSFNSQYSCSHYDFGVGGGEPTMHDKAQTRKKKKKKAVLTLFRRFGEDADNDVSEVNAAANAKAAENTQNIDETGQTKSSKDDQGNDDNGSNNCEDSDDGTLFVVLSDGLDTYHGR